jgi:HEPN domain-containing protein/predicted nucleotidyltransferase
MLLGAEPSVNSSMTSPNGVGDPTLDFLADAIREAAQPRRIVLFGSRARGAARLHSDYDLYVEVDAGVDPRAIHFTIRDALVDNHIATDVIVGAADEYAWRRDDVGCVEFDVEREGVVLYDRDRRPMPPPRLLCELPRSRVIREWIDRAQEDFTGMELMVGATPPLVKATVFHAHEFTEKLLKCALYVVRRPPPRTHATKELLAESPEPLRGDPGLRLACNLLDDLYPSSRYGPVFPTLEDARDAVKAARLVRDRVMPLIERLYNEDKDYSSDEGGPPDRAI